MLSLPLGERMPCEHSLIYIANPEITVLIDTKNLGQETEIRD
jgi:hypothetical protein